MATTIKMKGLVSSIMGTFSASETSASKTSVSETTAQAHSVTARTVPAPMQNEITSTPTTSQRSMGKEATSQVTKSLPAASPPSPTSPLTTSRKAIGARPVKARKVTPVSGSEKCRRYLILNGKGGCGKTTISTNLASYFACKGHRTAIMDYDPQESSLTWLKLRGIESADAPKIHGIAAHAGAGGLVTRSWQLRTPPGTERVIVDAPAGIAGADLIDMLKNVHAIVIPVLPSSIDMHATARFIQDLLLVGKVRARNIPVCIVANRVPKQTQAYKKLMLFLSALNIPFVVKFKDNPNYLNAAELGLGVHELPSSNINEELAQWDTLADWLENGGKSKSTVI